MFAAGEDANRAPAGMMRFCVAVVVGGVAATLACMSIGHFRRVELTTVDKHHRKSRWRDSPHLRFLFALLLEGAAVLGLLRMTRWLRVVSNETHSGVPSSEAYDAMMALVCVVPSLTCLLLGVSSVTVLLWARSARGQRGCDPSERTANQGEDTSETL